MGKVIATVQVNGNEVYLVQEGNHYFIYWGEAKQEGKASIELLTPKGRKPTKSSAYKKFLQAVDAAQYLKFEKTIMAAISDNKYDIFSWVSNVIDSCENLDHINSAERLTDRFWISSRDQGLSNKLHAKLNVKIQLLKQLQNGNQ